jgi:hypothetical protein
MTSVRGGQASVTGGDQAKVGLYKTTDGGDSWALVFEATIDPFSSDGTPEGVFERISGVKDIQFDPQNPDTVWISVADDGVYRSAPDIEPGDDDSFKKVFEIVGVIKYDSYAAMELVVKDDATRVYLYNGNGRNVAAQALYRLDNANVLAASLYNAGNQAAWVNKTELNDWPDYADWILRPGRGKPGGATGHCFHRRKPGQVHR